MNKRYFVVLATLFFGIIHPVGIGRDLPYAPHIDEVNFVASAQRIVDSGSLNPEWFGHPGSTVIYPLALAIKVSDYLGGPFYAGWVKPFLIGRLIVIGYSVLSVQLLYCLVNRLFGEVRSAVAVSLYIFYPLVVRQSQIVRTDSAATFWGLVALNLFVISLKDQTIRKYIMTGTAVGLAISSRYFMVALIPLFFVRPIMDHLAGAGLNFRSWFRSVAGAFVALMSFLITTPYLILDYQRAFVSISIEARSVHPGADGLSKAGNLIWYLTQAFPDTITYLQMGFMMIGLVLALKHTSRAGTIVFYLVVFLLLISYHPLHWQRWLIPVLPVAAALAAHGFVSTVERFSDGPVLLGIGMMVLLVKPIVMTYQNSDKHFTPSTRVMVSEWILRNVPSGSNIVTEVYTAGLVTERFYLYDTFRPSQTRNNYTVYQTDTVRHTSPDYFIGHDYEYFVINRSRLSRTRSEQSGGPIYPTYSWLRQNGELILLMSGAGRPGDSIEIYYLNDKKLDIRKNDSKIEAP